LKRRAGGREIGSFEPIFLCCGGRHDSRPLEHEHNQHTLVVAFSLSNSLQSLTLTIRKKDGENLNIVVVNGSDATEVISALGEWGSRSDDN
jgi:hypothetical protein